MRYLTGRKIIFSVTDLLIVLAIAGWFLFGPNLLKAQTSVVPGSTIDFGCQAVYQKVMTDGFAGHRLQAQPGFVIEKALFISVQEAKSRYDSQITAPDDARLCYVLVRGNIEVGSPFTNQIATYPTGSAIYDAQTLSTYSIGTGEHY